MDLSVVIVNWNTRDLLRNCLRSVYACWPETEYELIVVDNASSDNSVAMVRNEFPRVDLIVNDQNVGFAQANNQGMTRCSRKYIVLLNPDTIVHPNAFDNLVSFMDAHPEAGAAGPLLLNPDGSLQLSCYPFPTIRRELWRLFHLDKVCAYGVYPMALWDHETIREVEHIKGACLILRKEAVNRAGWLDEDYFMYSEELDLCYRLSRMGWKLFWVPQSKVTHHGGQSTNQAAKEMFLELYRSKILFFRKNHPQTVRAYKSILILAAIFRMILMPAIFFESTKQRAKHLNLIHNYSQLIKAIPGM